MVELSIDTGRQGLRNGLNVYNEQRSMIKNLVYIVYVFRNSI